MSYCLVPVQTTVAIVLGEAGVRLPVLGQLHCCVLAVHHPDHLFARYKISNIHPGTRFCHLSPQLALVEVADGQHGLLGLRHLDQGGVLLVEQNLHPLQRDIRLETPM